jgi:hypothetical protein
MHWRVGHTVESRSVCSSPAARNGIPCSSRNPAHGCSTCVGNATTRPCTAVGGAPQRSAPPLSVGAPLPIEGRFRTVEDRHGASGPLRPRQPVSMSTPHDVPLHPRNGRFLAAALLLSGGSLERQRPARESVEHRAGIQPRCRTHTWRSTRGAAAWAGVCISSAAPGRKCPAGD